MGDEINNLEKKPPMAPPPPRGGVPFSTPSQPQPPKPPVAPKPAGQPTPPPQTIRPAQPQPQVNPVPPQPNMVKSVPPTTPPPPPPPGQQPGAPMTPGQPPRPPMAPGQPPRPPMAPPQPPKPAPSEEDDVKSKKKKKRKGEEPETEEEILEKSYKSGLSDKDKHRKKKRRRLLLLLLLLLLINGSVFATYYIIKSKDDSYIPEFNDNVVIQLDDLEFISPATELHFPGSVLEVENAPLKVTVPTNFDDVYFDVVAFAVEITANIIEYDDVGEVIVLDDCSSIIDVEYCTKADVFNNTFLSWSGSNSEYLNVGQNPGMVYIQKVLEPVEGRNIYNLINNFRITPGAGNEYANKTIRIQITVHGTYPSEDKIRSENSIFRSSPSGWSEVVENEAKKIFIRRQEEAKNK